jgi:hypothetical protein
MGPGEVAPWCFWILSLGVIFFAKSDRTITRSQTMYNCYDGDETPSHYAFLPAPPPVRGVWRGKRISPDPSNDKYLEEDSSLKLGMSWQRNEELSRGDTKD